MDVIIFINVLLSIIFRFLFIRKWIRPANIRKIINQISLLNSIIKNILLNKIPFQIRILLSFFSNLLIYQVIILKELNLLFNMTQNLTFIISRLMRIHLTPLEKGNYIQLIASLYILGQDFSFHFRFHISDFKQ